MRHIAAAAAVPTAVRANFKRRPASPRAQPQRRLASARRGTSAAARWSTATTTMALSLPAAVAIPVLGGFGVATRMNHQARASQQHAQHRSSGRSRKMPGELASPCPLCPLTRAAL
jgi:hypothetical protein